MAEIRTPDPAAVTSFGEDVKPYKIRISTKYLDLTKQKLELTRLPHENSEPKSTSWWEPKAQVEPLIDFWLEEYSWRDEEAKLNETVPQFRTGILLPGTESAIRIHFIHSPSPHSNAIPLLLIPPFPFTNLSLSHLVTSFVDPDDAGAKQPFHLVIPSLPGLGFSDALPNNTPVIASTADLLNTLMKRLGYDHYIVSNSGPSDGALSQVDFALVDHLASQYSESCVGAHLISPPLLAPTIRNSPLEWAKWKIVSLAKRPRWGYAKEDLAESQQTRSMASSAKQRVTPRSGFASTVLQEPNTLSYALCDSPTGLLLFFMMTLRLLGLSRNLSPQEIITLTELTWLPGPEATMRFWAHASSSSHNQTKATRKAAKKTKVGITVFLGAEGSSTSESQTQTDSNVLPRPTTTPYACPGWGRTRYNVMATHRVPGTPGLLLWDRPDVIADGARELSKAILAVDKRMQAAEQPGAVLLEQVTIGRDLQAPADTSGTTVQESGESPSAAPKKSMSPAKGTAHLEVPGQQAGLTVPQVRDVQQPLPSPESPTRTMTADQPPQGPSITVTA